MKEYFFINFMNTSSLFFFHRILTKDSWSFFLHYPPAIALICINILKRGST